MSLLKIIQQLILTSFNAKHWWSGKVSLEYKMKFRVKLMILEHSVELSSTGLNADIER